MAYEDTDDVWKWRHTVRHPACDLSGNARLVLHTLALFYNRRTGRCNPSVAKIARTAGIGTSTVHDKLNELEQAGYLTRHKMHGRSSLYVPQIPGTVEGAPWFGIKF